MLTNIFIILYIFIGVVAGVIADKKIEEPDLGPLPGIVAIFWPISLCVYFAHKLGCKLAKFF